jgi:glycosyltransferase involved in cell wall biosynthesis
MRCTSCSFIKITRPNSATSPVILVQKHGIRCTFVSQHAPGQTGGVEKIQYHLQGGATPQTHYCNRTCENAVWHSHAIYDALRARPDVKPDLIVGHSGFLTTTFLSELYHCPAVNYFEYYYWTSGSDMDFRPDFPCRDIDRLRARVRNAVLLLDLDNCRFGYSPTQWQRDRLPKEYHAKVRVIFDGIDTRIWQPRPELPRRVGRWNLPEGMRVVTYVARGMESFRGFDIFMKMAKIISERRQDVTFVVVGEDRVVYGGDKEIIGNRTFKEWVLAQDKYDLSRFVFTGLLPVNVLAQLLAISDLHVYLSVPFVLSWSLMDALACGATVVASDTAPVREMIEHEKNGLLVDFFDIEGLVETASKVLDAPQAFKYLGQAGRQMIQERYSLDVCLPQMLQLYQEAVGAM